MPKPEIERLILVGGAARSGKSILARLLLEEQGIPYCSLDNCMMGFQIAFPECGIRASQTSQERARKFWPWIRHMCQGILNSGETAYLVEGDVLFPEHLQKLQEKYPGRVSGCFLGYSHADPGDISSRISKYPGSNDWMQKLSPGRAADVINAQIEFSQFLEAESNQRGMIYVDTGSDFMAAVRKTCKLLSSGGRN